MLIFVTTHKTTRFHWEALTAKNIKVHSFRITYFYCIYEGAAFFRKKFLGNHAYFTQCQCVQIDAKDCNSHVYTITLLQKFFVHIARVSVSFDYLVIFLHPGKPDWIIHLNAKSKNNFGTVNCELQFFLKSPNVIGNLYCFTNYLLSN